MQRTAIQTVRFALVALLFGAAGWAAAITIARPSVAAAGPPASISAALGSAFTVQGRLEDGDHLAEGPYDFELRLFDDEVAGAQVGSTQTITDVSVTEGLFNLVSDFGNVFTGQALWLEISVRPGGNPGPFTPLSPRQALTGAPYALGLMPGVQVDTDDAANNPYVLNLVNDSGASEGDVIKAYSTNGEGLEGYSTGGAVADTGVYGQSNGTGSADAGVRGYASGAGPGLYGQGVGVDATSYGARGTSSSTHGIYGESNAGSTAYFGGWFTGEKGVYGNAESTSGDGTYGFCSSGSSCWGARGNSVGGYGVQGNTSRTDQMYGVHTSDMMYAGAGYNSIAGFSLIAQNGGSSALEVGDVVVANGMSEAFEESSSPILQVGLADFSTADRIIGVVVSALQLEHVTKPGAVYEEAAITDPEGEEDDSQWLVKQETQESVTIHHSVEGPADPGMYVMIRIQGLAQLKVDASAAAITIGIPLVAGDNGTAISAEAAMRQDGVKDALTIGQAVEPLDGGTGLIWVLVNPR